MEQSPLTKEQEQLLRKPLPPEAIKPHPTKTYLSTIKAIYVIERFNEVFGVGNWTLENQLVCERETVVKDKHGNAKQSRMVVVETKFICRQYGINIPSYGGNDNDDLGDAYKGAVTDAVTKIGSYLGIGMDVFKGLNETHNAPAEKPAQPGTAVPKTAGTAIPRITPPRIQAPSINQQQHA